MVPAYFVLTTLLLVLIYNITTGSNQFETTASLIRQIWSGRCRSCPQTTFSELSVLSRTIDTNRASTHGGTSHNQDCVCDSCPCALVENLLMKCSPVTQVLQETVHAIRQLICNIFNVIENVCGDLARALECGGTCQREPQALNNDSNTSTANPSFSKKDAPKKPEISNVQRKKSSISFIIDAEESNNKDKSQNKKNQESSNKDEPKKKSKQELNIIEQSKTYNKTEKEAMQPKSQSSDDTLKPSNSALASYCSKCKQQNKTCTIGCPKSKK